MVKAGGISPTFVPVGAAGTDGASVAGAVGASVADMGGGAGSDEAGVAASGVGAAVAVVAAGAVVAGAAAVSVGVGGSVGDVAAGAVVAAGAAVADSLTAVGASVAAACGADGCVAVAAAVTGASVAGDPVVGCAAGCARAAGGAGGAGSAPHAERIATIPAAIVMANIPCIFFMSFGFRRQRRRTLSSSTWQLQVLLSLVFLSLDFHLGRDSVRILGQCSKVRFPSRRAAHHLAVVDHPVPVHRHHGHLPCDLQVGQHRAHGLGGYYVGVTMLLDIFSNFVDRLVVRYDVEVKVWVS